MKNVLNIFAFIFSAFLLFSCEPSRDLNGDFLIGVNQNPGGNGGGGNIDNRLLKKILSHSLNEDTGEYEDGTTVFNYQNSKLISLNDDATGGLLNVEYNSANKISKIFSDGALTATFEYSGTTLSKITTTIMGLSESVTNYTFAGDKMVKSITITELTFSPIPAKVYTEDTYEYQNNNVTKNTTKIGLFDPVTGELIIDPGSVISVFEYDNKKSPYTLLPKEFVLFFSSISPQTGFLSSANNPVKSTVTDQDGAVDVTTITNEYDSKDYATKSTSGEEYTNYEYQ